jgi:hypothetical protein
MNLCLILREGGGYLSILGVPFGIQSGSRRKTSYSNDLNCFLILREGDDCGIRLGMIVGYNQDRGEYFILK